MRALASALAFTLALSGAALAQPQPSSPSSPSALAPGKPAGLQQAQRGDNTLLIVLGVGVVAGGIALAAAGGNDDNRNPVVPTTTTAP